MSEETTTVEDKAVEVPEKFKALVSQIEEMSVLDLSELVTILEDKFGVSAAAPVAIVQGGGGDSDAPEEKDSFDVILSEVGQQKIQVIKAVREITGKGLKEAKDVVDAAPGPVVEGVKKEDAEEMKQKIEDAGGVVELK